MPGDSRTFLPLFQTLVEVVARLRGPKGCPWDKEQTQTSLTQYAIEEAFELAEALESGRQDEIRDELGDYLFQVILQAQVAQDEGHFTLADVIRGLSEKMIRRHPHVFGEVELKDSEAVWRNWDKLKHQEKPKNSPNLFSYPRNLPALQAAAKIGRKTETWKFDWSSAEEVFAKLEEELLETREALRAFRARHPSSELKPESPGRDELIHEIGDLLFSTAQFARHLGLDPESCLREANRRFEGRFQKVIEKAGLPKDEFAALSNEKKEELWNEIKKHGKGSSR